MTIETIEMHGCTCDKCETSWHRFDVYVSSDIIASLLADGWVLHNDQWLCPKCQKPGDGEEIEIDDPF